MIFAEFKNFSSINSLLSFQFVITHEKHSPFEWKCRREMIGDYRYKKVYLNGLQSNLGWNNKKPLKCVWKLRKTITAAILTTIRRILPSFVLTLLYSLGHPISETCLVWACFARTPTLGWKKNTCWTWFAQDRWHYHPLVLFF